MGKWSIALALAALVGPALALAQAETRASQLIGMEVENSAGDTVGEIEELVIDMGTGRVQSVVLEADDAGRGERLHAYRLGDFSMGSGRRLGLNVDREALRRTRGFAQDLWPSWGEAYWRAEPGMRLMRAAELMNRQIRDRNGAKAGEVQDLVIDLRGGVVTHAVLDIAGSRREARVPMKEVALAPNGAPVLNVDRAQLIERAASEMRARRLIDMEVENRQGRTLGEVEDLVVDLASGRVLFAVLGFESAFNLGSKLFAYRLGDFGIGNGRKLVLDLDPVELRQARGFDEDAWPAWNAPYWRIPAPAVPVRARELLGKDVRRRDGTQLGEIDDLVVDLRSGAVTHAIIHIENRLQRSRVPVDALAMNLDTGEVTLGIDREQQLR